jgi:hypothetical protein
MVTKRFRPTLEELNARAVPNSTLNALPFAADAAHSAPSPSHPYHGSGQGQYLQPMAVDLGMSYRVTGKTTINGLGEFRVNGWLQGTGLILDGRATGHLTLSDAKGSITLELHGGRQPTFSPIPSELVYSITGGTGAYSHSKGYGVAGFSFTTAPTAVGFPLTGSFAIKLS